jgi:elongation factor 3
LRLFSAPADVGSVAWLERYLCSQTQITCIMVSHDSGFLDNTCTDIMHYENKKIAYYKGNLSKFVERVPEAKSYYTLAATSIAFKFPPPGSLMGVRSNTRSIMKLTNCTFTYPGAPRPQLHDVSCALTLSSRVGILGPNGAGKSTLIKLLTGETIPDSGKVDKHPALRVGYVAQHAFHHLEQHLEKTPVAYMFVDESGRPPFRTPSLTRTVPCAPTASGVSRTATTARSSRRRRACCRRRRRS